VNRHWMVQGKLGYTRYFDRTSIGSDLERIDGNTKTDLNILVRMNY
jgi:hypothetical protein